MSILRWRTYFIQQGQKLLLDSVVPDHGSPRKTQFAGIHFLLKPSERRGAKKSVQYIFIYEINMKQ